MSLPLRSKTDSSRFRHAVSGCTPDFAITLVGMAILGSLGGRNLHIEFVVMDAS